MWSLRQSTPSCPPATDALAPEKRTFDCSAISVAKGPACVERGLYGAIASATPVSRSWSTDLNRTGSLTAADAPYGVYWH